MGQVLPVVSHVEPNLPAQDFILGHLVHDTEFTVTCTRCQASPGFGVDRMGAFKYSQGDARQWSSLLRRPALSIVEG